MEDAVERLQSSANTKNREIGRLLKNIKRLRAEVQRIEADIMRLTNLEGIADDGWVVERQNDDTITQCRGRWMIDLVDDKYLIFALRDDYTLGMFGEYESLADAKAAAIEMATEAQGIGPLDRDNK